MHANLSVKQVGTSLVVLKVILLILKSQAKWQVFVEWQHFLLRLTYHFYPEWYRPLKLLPDTLKFAMALEIAGHCA